MRVLITGATGLVGSHLLQMLVAESKVTRIFAPTRRPLPPREKVVNGVDPQLSDVLVALTEPVDVVFCCLGTTRKEAGSKEAFIHVDYTLPVDTGITGKRLGARHMLVVSAIGANTHSLFLYNRVKGEMENALIAQGWPRLTLARPSMLLGERGKRRMNESLMAPIFRLLPGDWKAISARDVARAMLREALGSGPTGVNVISSHRLMVRAHQE